MNERLNEIKQSVRASIRRHTHKDFIGYGDCNDICCDMQTCLDSVRDEQSDLVLVFDVALFMLITGAKLASTADSSSGYLSAVIDHSLALLREVIEAISITQDVTMQSKCYVKLIKESQNKAFDGWTEWRYELLECSITLATENNLSKLDEALEYRAQNERECGSRYAQSRQLVIRAKVKRKFEGNDSAKRFMYAHLDDDGVREEAVRNAIEDADYLGAERLCKDKLAHKPFEYYGCPTVWRTLLFDNYQKTGDEDKLLEAAEDLFFLGDHQRLSTMISIYEKRGEWKDIRPLFLKDCEDRLPEEAYMALLKQLGEWRLLMSAVANSVQVGTNNNMGPAFDYFDDLITLYPQETISAYSAQVKKTASGAANRKQYRSVCRRIEKLIMMSEPKSFSSKSNKAAVSDDTRAMCKNEALTLIDELERLYQNRPAFVEELDNVR